MPNVLVTGGAGFIGSALVDRLISEGHKVYVIDNMSTGLSENINTSAEYLIADIRDYIEDSDSLLKFIENNDIRIVYHLAAFTDVGLSTINPYDCYNINQLASIALFDACVKSKIEKFIFTSTSAVYGSPIRLPVDEQHPLDPISPYGLSKLAFEQYAKYKVREDMSLVIFRLPNVYGPRQRYDLEGGVIAIFHDLMKKDKDIVFYGDGEQTRDWVHVEDIVNAFLLIINMTFKENPTMNLGSCIDNSLWDLFAVLSNSLSYEKEPIIEAEREGDIKHMYLDYKKASKFIGWKPVIKLIDGINLIK